MLAAIGDLVEDIVVHLRGSVQLASDTASTITRRRGGSAANVCAAAALAGAASRFIGQVGDDAAGTMLTGLLADAGVDLAVRRDGRTGTIVVIVDAAGERTMFPDAGASRRLDSPERAWLDGVDTLHVPVYSLVDEPIAATSRTLAGWAHDSGITVSIDASSAGVLEDAGVERMIDVMRSLRPHVLFANEDEASCLGEAGLGRIGARIVVVKHGPRPALVHVVGAAPVAVAANDLGPVADTTAAGDSFAAGFLIALAAGTDPVDAARRGHDLAAHVITTAR